MNKDQCIAILSYRATRLPWCELSPSELLMVRRIRTGLPQIREEIPSWSYMHTFRNQDEDYKDKQAQSYNKYHPSGPLEDIPSDTDVWVRSGKENVPGTVSSEDDTPRSYLVDTPSGPIQRNQVDLNPKPETESNCELSSGSTQQDPNSQPLTQSPIKTRSTTGTPIIPPDRLVYS